jgi:hypothetical protein
MRTTIAQAPNVAGMVAPGDGGTETDLDCNSRVSKPRVALARYLGIRILQRRYDSRNAGGNNGVGARW